MKTPSARFAMRLGGTLLLLVSLGGCEPRGNPDPASQSNPPSGDGTTVGEEGVIRQLGERHARAVAARDTIGAGEIYAEDVIYLPADGAPEHGHEAVRSAWARGLQATDYTIRYRTESLEVSRSADMASERGVVAISRSGKPLFDGNYVYVWRKRDGQWRVTLYMWNTRDAGS